MQRLALAVIVCASVLACHSGGSPAQPSPNLTPAGTRIIVIEGDLNFGDIAVPAVAEKTIRVLNRGTDTMRVTGFTGPRGGGVCQYPSDMDVCGAVSVGWAGGDIAPSQWHDVTVRFDTAWGDSVSGTLTVNANATGANAVPITARSVPRK